MNAVIAGTGCALPARIVDNDQFAAFLETTDDWITSRTGIRARRYVDDHETSATLAIAAGKNALTTSAVDPAEIELIICGTSTPDQITPSNACIVQSALGCPKAMAFDLSAACSGFLYSLTVADRFIRSGTRHALVIGSDVLSRAIDFSDRSSCILFGDGAGAAVLSASDERNRGIIHSQGWADGSRGQFIRVPNLLKPTSALASIGPTKDSFLMLEGRETYRFAIETMVQCVRGALDDCGLTLKDVSWIVPHQVNLRVFEAVAKELDWPLERIAINIDRLGNTGAASLPIALHELASTGQVNRDDVLVLVSFGGGLTWSSTVVRW